mmetsp:Transcript_18478/g.33472  ORF Transcript_18478/g.33472 Transcript_18478/m.33472 type:complete len:87 (+) Transcript_18478:257-517(+)
MLTSGVNRKECAVHTWLKEQRTHKGKASTISSDTTNASDRRIYVRRFESVYFSVGDTKQGYEKKVKTKSFAADSSSDASQIARTDL